MIYPKEYSLFDSSYYQYLITTTRHQLRVNVLSKDKTLMVSRPRPLPRRTKGGEELYWDSLPTFSDIGGPKSYNLIKISYTKIQK